MDMELVMTESNFPTSSRPPAANATPPQSRDASSGRDGDREGRGESARDKFARLAKQSEAALMRAALRLCRGGHDCAQELVQDAMVRAYEAFRKGQFDAARSTTPASVAAWFVRIMTNNFINTYRRSQKWDAGVTFDTLTSGGAAGPKQTQANPDDMPGELLMSHTLDEPVEYALAQLPDGLRMVVLLVDVQGYSYDEAAQMMGIPVGTVRSRLSRARYQLHDLLRDYAQQRRLIP